jgi:hypothetical protein
MNLDKALREIKEKLVSSLITRQTKYGFYIHINLKCFFHNTKTDEDIEFYVGSLTHRRDEVYVSRREELHKVISLCLEEIKNRIYSRECTESGFTFKTIDEVYVSLFRYHGNKLIQITQEPAPIGYKYRELPVWIRRSRSIINIQNKDDSCFEWCIARFFCQEENGFRITKKLKEQAKKFEWFGLDDPKSFTEQNLCKFEDYHNFRIIIFGIDDEPGYRIMHLRSDKDNPKYTKIYLGHYIDHFFLITNLKGFIVVM